MGDVQLVIGSGATPTEHATADFVEVVVTATGQTATVPADWVGDPVLGVGISPVAEVPADEPVPTKADTHEVIDAFAEKAGVDLGEAKTKAEKLAAIHEVLPAPAPEPEPTPVGNPDVQLAAGTEASGPVIGAHLIAGVTESPEETPASGDEEN